MMDFVPGNPRIFEYEPFVVVTPWNRPHFDFTPLGLEIPGTNFIDPMRLESEAFLLLLQEMDRQTFGPEGMPMPRWVFYNCSELPGGIVGFARRAKEMTVAQRERLQVPDAYEGLVPFSMFIAIPMLPAGDWMGHNLCSLNGVFPEAGLSGLASTTKALGLSVYRTRRLFGATQWESRALHIHTKFGPLDLVTAYTPAHSEPMTLTYRVEITVDGLLNACGDPSAQISRPEPTLWMDATDEDRANKLQDEIEAGERYQITGRPEEQGDKLLIPLVKNS